MIFASCCKVCNIYMDVERVKLVTSQRVHVFGGGCSARLSVNACFNGGVRACGHVCMILFRINPG